MTKPRTGRLGIPPSAKVAFWKVVEECLTTFHQFAPPDAALRAAQMRAEFEQAPPGIDGDIIYHDEPFDIACEIADNPLDLAAHRPQYDAILRRHNW